MSKNWFSLENLKKKFILIKGSSMLKSVEASRIRGEKSRIEKRRICVELECLCFVGARVPVVESSSSLSLRFESQNLSEGSSSILFIERLMRPLESLLGCWRSLLDH